MAAKTNPDDLDTSERADGQQVDYLVAKEEARKRGFVRPVYRAYRHTTCGVVTKISLAIAETYAHNPKFYSATFCCGCGAHFPVGEAGQFTWETYDGTAGLKVGT